jgi:hypothetical protein
MRKRLTAWLRGDAPLASLDADRNRCVDASDLVEQLPNGPTRAAAWAAYAQQAYAEKLVATGDAEGYVRADTAYVARSAYRLAAESLAVAQSGSGEVPRALPRWRSPVRSPDELLGMRRALEALKTFLAFELKDDNAPELARLNAELARAERFWIERPPPEIRGAVGDALVRALDEAYELGRRLTAVELR